MTVGEKIRAERKALGLTQTKLGERLGVRKNAVSKWECGRVDDIPGSKIKAMAALFRVPPSYLIDDESALPAQVEWDDFTYAMHNETKDLPEEKKRMLLDMARFMKADLEKERS